MQQILKLDKISLVRIGIFDPYLDDLGGGEKYMMTIAEFLSQNHQVDVFWDERKDLETLLERFSLDLSKVKLVENIFKPHFSKLKRLIETRKYDSLIVLSDGSIPLVSSKKLFIHIQQPLMDMQAYSLMGKIKLSRVNAFFSNSEYTRSFLDKRFQVKSIVITPPVSIHKIKVKKENIILHVGRFRVKNVTASIDGKKIGIGDYKKQSVMVNAFKEMIDKGLKDWKLVIATSVQKEDEEDFRKMSNIPKGYPIEFLVNKKNQELWDIYSKAKIYWHASGYGEDLRSHPEFAEHFGISTVEAMGAGAVPVVINAGGQKEIVKEEENGYLWDTISELKSKTLKLIKNEVFLKGLSKKAVESSQKFSKENFNSQINDLILS